MEIRLLKSAALAAGLLLGLGACNNDDEGGGSAPLSSVEITVSEVAENSVSIDFTPATDKGAYYAEVLEKTAFDAFASDGDYQQSILDRLGQLAREQSKTLQDIVAELTHKGRQKIPFSQLDPATEYVVCAFGISSDGKTVGTLFKESFTTSMPATLESIEISVSELTKNSVTVKFTPSTELLAYYGTIIDKAYYDDFESDEAYIQDDIEFFSMLAEKEDKEVPVMIGELTHKGEQSLPFQNLTPGTDYYAYAFGVNTDGSVTSVLFKEPFTTPMPERSENQLSLNVSKIGADGALVEATATNNDPYIFDVWEASKLEGKTDEQIMQTIVAAYSAEDLKKITETDSASIDATGELKAGTAYIALAFGYEAGVFTTDLIQSPFSTKENGWVDCSYTFTKETLNCRMASYTVTASDNTVPFFFSLITAAQLTEIGDTDDAIKTYIMSKIQEEADEFGYPLETVLRLLLFRETKTETYTELSPETDYYLVAVGINAEGDYITDVARSHKITTPGVSSATVTFGTPVITDLTVSVSVSPGAGTSKWKAAAMFAYYPFYTESYMICHLLTNVTEENTATLQLTATEKGQSLFFVAVGLDADGNPGNLVKIEVPVN